MFWKNDAIMFWMELIHNLTRGMASMPTSLFVNIVVWFGRNTFLYKLFIIIVKKHCNKKYLNNSTTKLNYSLKTTKYKKINICFSNI